MIAECKIYFVTDVRTLIAALGWGQTRLPSSNTYLLPIFIIHGNRIATKNNRRTNVKKKLWKRIRTHSANIIKTSRLIFHKVKVTSRRWVARKIRIAPTSYITFVYWKYSVLQVVSPRGNNDINFTLHHLFLQ